MDKTEEVELLKQAVDLMIRTPQAANDMMLVASIKDYVDPYKNDKKGNIPPKPIDFNKQGKLLHQQLIKFKMFVNSGGNSSRLASTSQVPTPNLTRKNFKKTYSSATFFNDDNEEKVLSPGRIFIFEQCLALATDSVVKYNE